MASPRSISIHTGCSRDHSTNGKFLILICRSRPLFAHVLFTRTPHANRFDRDEPGNPILAPGRGCRANPVQARRDWRHVHLCKTIYRDESLFLVPCAIARPVIRAVTSVLAPVIRVTLQPRPLRVTLVIAVVRVVAELVLLPSALSGPLACL